MEKNLLEEIFLITEKIRLNFPSCYYLLNETPLFLSYDVKGIEIVDLEQYLESMVTQFQQMILSKHIALPG